MPMKENTPVKALKHRDLVYEALMLVMGKVQVGIGDKRLLDLYGELKSRLECGEDVCDKCREKVPVSEMVDA